MTAISEYGVELTKKTQNGVVIVSVSDRLDGITAPDLENCLDDTVKKTDSNIILEFSELKYISSAGLRVVLATVKKLKAENRDLCLAGLKGAVKDVFQLSGFYAILKIFDTIDMALEQC